MNIEEKGKNRIFLPVIGVAILVIAVIGISFAIYTNTFDSEENTITTGTIMVSYTESTNAISILDALPISDASGKVLDGENETFEFSVSTKADGELTIPYVISLTKVPGDNDLLDSEVKVYLTKDDGEEVVAPIKVDDLDDYNETYSTDTRPNTFILYEDAKDEFTGSEESATTTNYVLRMWIDANTVIDNNSTKSYTLKVNVDSNVKPLSNQ